MVSVFPPQIRRLVPVMSGLLLCGVLAAVWPVGLSAAVVGTMAAPPEPSVCLYLNVGAGFEALVNLAGSAASAGRVLTVASAPTALDGLRAVEPVASGSGSGGSPEGGITRPGDPLVGALAGLQDWCRMWQGILPRLGTDGDVIRTVRRTLGFCRERGFIPSDLYVYLDPPEDFVFLLTGSVEPERWRPLFPAERVLRRPGGFAVSSDPATTAGNPSLLSVGPGFLLVCPANLEGSILDGLRDAGGGLGERWNTFRSLVRHRPLLAAEANMARLWERLGTKGVGELPLPVAIRDLHLLRLAADERVLKAQLFSERETSRPSLERLAGEAREALLALAGPGGETASASLASAFRGLRSTIQGRSVFLEGTGLGAARSRVALLQTGFLAWLLGSLPR